MSKYSSILSIHDFPNDMIHLSCKNVCSVAIFFSIACIQLVSLTTAASQNNNITLTVCVNFQPSIHLVNILFSDSNTQLICNPKFL